MLLTSTHHKPTINQQSFPGSVFISTMLRASNNHHWYVLLLLQRGVNQHSHFIPFLLSLSLSLSLSPSLRVLPKAKSEALAQLLVNHFIHVNPLSPGISIDVLRFDSVQDLCIFHEFHCREPVPQPCCRNRTGNTLW